ncbi:MAG TPA: DinB family protein [Gemmatimonadales bacterium]|nr:DinB family protein [Gemmatimonadales bacterium]
MTFSNPAGNAAAAAAAYIRALLDLLGPRDPLAVMRELLPWLDDRLRGVGEGRLRQPEAPGKWSVIEVIQHLADSDLVAGFRIRMMLSEDRPPLQGYDQDRWAREFRYREVSLDQALGQLRGLRTANLHLWGSLSPSQLARVGLHSERGAESAGFLLRLMGGHDLVHRRQIDRILAAVQPSDR